jgi:hypothetical protein
MQVWEEFVPAPAVFGGDLRQRRDARAHTMSPCRLMSIVAGSASAPAA